MKEIDAVHVMAEAMKDAFVRFHRSASGEERRQRPLTDDEATVLAREALLGLNKAGLQICERVGGDDAHRT